VLRRLLIAASAVALVVAAVLAATDSRNGPPFTRDEVVRAFARQGFDLAEPDFTSTGASGWTGYAPMGSRSEGTLLFMRPPKKAEFYVFVASSTALAKRYFEPLVRLGGTPDTFDLRRGNVIVSSDSSFTENGLSQVKRARIRDAMNELGTSPPPSEVFAVRKGMTKQEVRLVSGTPYRAGASCWLYHASKPGTSIDAMRFCFTNGRVSLIQIGMHL
jgi:hypothetical protein